MKKDLFLSIITQILILLTFLISYKLIAMFFGKSSFELYSLIKRDITFILAFLGLGLYTSILRYSSYYQKHNLYVLISSYIIFLINLVFIFLILFLFKKEEFFYLFFLKIFKIDNFYILIALFVSLYGIYAHNILYAFLRGTSKHDFANGFDIYNKAFIPVLAVFIADNLIHFLLLQGILQIINSLVFSLFLIKKSNLYFSFKKVFLTLKKIITYGLKRIGADIGLNILLFLPIIFSSKTNAGKIAFSITLLTINGYFFTPIGSVILPKIVTIYKSGSFNILKKLTIKVVFLILVLSFMLMILFLFFLKIILSSFLKEVDIVFYNEAFIILLSIIPFVFYLVLKNIIDAIWIKGINSFNIILSIFIYFISIFILGYFKVPFKESISFTISIYFLGILTLVKILDLILKAQSEFKI